MTYFRRELLLTSTNIDRYDETLNFICGVEKATGYGRETEINA